MLDEFIDEPKETFEEEQARKKAAIQAIFDMADRVHYKSTESWAREELAREVFGIEYENFLAKITRSVI